MGLEEDRLLLERAIDNEDLTDRVRTIFEDMRATLDRYNKPLSAAQRQWVSLSLEGEQYVAEEKYENLVSSGKVAAVSTVSLLVKDKPLRPPGRRA